MGKVARGTKIAIALLPSFAKRGLVEVSLVSLQAWWREPHHIWRVRSRGDHVVLILSYLSLLFLDHFPHLLSLNLSPCFSLFFFLTLFLFHFLQSP